MSVVDVPCEAEPMARRARGDDGAATSLSVALLTPVFVVLCFAAVQAALWSHARTEARAAARDVAALVARSAVAPDDAAASTRSVLEADTSMSGVVVDVVRSGDVVSVRVTADAPGMIVGTSRRVDVTVALPMEEVTSP